MKKASRHKVTSSMDTRGEGSNPDGCLRLVKVPPGKADAMLSGSESELAAGSWGGRSMAGAAGLAA